ncbi:hypothetical protein K2Z83_18575 [Oscillochloris sp. ZM17-4]|uniref:hypothetical protein n=1 Tax=Oscillochloris sp. ZM17-4 TaxID=2866714 RepID=UPI001C72C14F|nr:hypothetical protein [Oscillochloris sp. ZM17-4]MBX0329679.1 hypothetical protein [Oscillochloris sp. ZM17-4]
MSRQLPALIAAESGELRAGLQALLESIPGIGPVAQARDRQALRELLAHDAPLLCLADYRLADAIYGRPRAIVVVLVERQGEQQPALAAGAARAVMKGTPAAQLVALIDALLTGAGAEGRAGAEEP